MSNVHRKHPVSIAVSMALLSAAAAAAMAAAPAPVPSETAASDANQPDATTVATSGRSTGSSAADDAVNRQGNVDQDESIVTVYGVRRSQIKAIEAKRLAPSIMDTISAESIGQLPDTTITDSLQRITGVQISRAAGIGTTVNIRGLPQVGTMLNGEVFITPDQIDSQQPDFGSLPATLFNQVDVVKSATASQTESGISGALNLHTFRPWDLPHGFTYSYSASGERGSSINKNGPQASGLVAFNADGRWGLQISGDYSDTTREYSSEGLDQYGVIFNGENATSAGRYDGFVGAWNGKPIPAGIVQHPDGSVDVNGDGKSNGVFMGSQNIELFDSSVQRRREATNVSFQLDLDHGLSLTSDYFYGHQNQNNRTYGLQFNSTNWQGATYIPLKYRNTGSTALSQYNTPGDPSASAFAGSQIYTTQIYEKYPGDVESYTSNTRIRSTAQNLNLQLDYNNGGPFRASIRGIRETAKQDSVESDVNISDSDGCQWLDPSSTLPCNTYAYPAALGGNRVFNPNGIPQNTVPFIADLRGRNMSISLPTQLASTFADPYGWGMKTLESGEDYDRRTAITALRFDGHYDVSEGIHLNFGVRNGLRTAHNSGFTLVAPVYAGLGASDPNGCLVRYIAADVFLSGNPDGTWCTAGSSEGWYRAGTFSAQPLPKTPAPLANAWRSYSNLLGSGVNFWAIDPKALDDPEGFWKAVVPGATRQASPPFTWGVALKETTTYLQTDFSGPLGDMTYSGNVGVRVIHSNLNVTQELTGLPGQYGTEPADLGQEVSRRSYNDVLPAINLALNVTEKFTVRASYSKNMMPLNLSQWGGGLQLNYSLQETPQGPINSVSAGSQAGNPKLNPWRSSNYGASFEYYLNPSTLFNLELFRIEVNSFITNGSVNYCNLPDEDGVVRPHCVPISGPLQGSGGSIQGAEFDYRQGFTFLPGLLANTGVEFNVTYAPSSEGGKRDLSGAKIPFPDNSEESGNLILWYQDKHFQARVAYNYRSRRAEAEDEGGILGLEEYEAAQRYLDASISYKFSKFAEVFVDGTNLTNEYQRFYLVWPDQPGHSTFSERAFSVGVRGQW